MAGNTFGKIFKVTNWGESHGKAIGVVIDGCPSLLELSEQDIQVELDRRKPGQSEISTSRKEPDKVEILSGVFEGKTSGTPISLFIRNQDFKKEDYQQLHNIYRPGHADYTYEKKYGIRDPFGGGRSSARITAGNVAAGAIAKKILHEKLNTEIIGYVRKIKNIEALVNPEDVCREKIENNMVRCPDDGYAKKMIDLIRDVKEKGDSIGGIIECIVRNVPAGLGEPYFDKLSADLAKAMMCINAAKGFEIGSGFDSVNYFGSELNDPFVVKGGRVCTESNNSGGVLGGISNGMPIVFRVAFKPTATIMKSQKTVDHEKKSIEFQAKGRHDPCVLPRAVPIVEAMAALVLCDHYLLQKKSLHDMIL